LNQSHISLFERAHFEFVSRDVMRHILDVVCGDVMISHCLSGDVLEAASVVPVGTISCSIWIVSQGSLPSLRIIAVDIFMIGALCKALLRAHSQKMLLTERSRSASVQKTDRINGCVTISRTSQLGCQIIPCER
jgi:hypothetical protein